MSDGPMPLAISWGFYGRDEDVLTIDRIRQGNGNDRFAVRHGRVCLNHKGEMEYEPQPSSRSDEFLTRCRFDTFEEAVAAAHAWMAKQ
jgi:hypothetical protein